MHLKQYFLQISRENLPKKIEELVKLKDDIIPGLINLSDIKKDEVIDIIN
jgi:hypothetical protein